MSEILLATLNARYSHASLGLRYLRANLGALRERSSIREFVIGQKTEEIAEVVLAANPMILGLGVYIWNCEETLKLVLMLKAVRPDLIIVLGGPEVSYETGEQAICTTADYTITGWGDISFAQLCAQILAGEAPQEKIIPGIQAKLDDIASPYAEYTEEDIRQRHLYVEASRGCPFKCEFCLSALDKTAWPFALENFLDDLEMLWQKGARQFKFVDRTFNLKIETSLRIMDFFLGKIADNPEDPPFAHFELIPDHLPEKLKDAIQRFPAGTLQFEIGIQTFNTEVQARISRKQKNELARDNILWLA
ncbi:MAG: cobalamin-dependent protein [Arenimonas sp.]|nr:cobalamin-dependent protein [Arenimonas sp.]